MAKVLFAADGEIGVGFQLAGLEVRCITSPTEAADLFLSLCKTREYGMVIVSETLFESIEESSKAKLEKSNVPLFVTVPVQWKPTAELAPEEYVARIVQRSIGFQVKIPKPQEGGGTGSEQ